MQRVFKASSKDRRGIGVSKWVDVEMILWTEQRLYEGNIKLLTYRSQMDEADEHETKRVRTLSPLSILFQPVESDAEA